MEYVEKKEKNSTYPPNYGMCFSCKNSYYKNVMFFVKICHILI